MAAHVDLLKTIATSWRRNRTPWGADAGAAEKLEVRFDSSTVPRADLGKLSGLTPSSYATKLAPLRLYERTYGGVRWGGALGGALG